MISKASTTAVAEKRVIELQMGFDRPVKKRGGEVEALTSDTIERKETLQTFAADIILFGSGVQGYTGEAGEKRSIDLVGRDHDNFVTVSKLEFHVLGSKEMIL